MKPKTIRWILDSGLSLLPDRMDSPEARVLLVTIGLQESGFEHRWQIRGPARGFWQFEQIGINGVLEHYTVYDTVVNTLHGRRTSIKDLLADLLYDLHIPDEICHEAVAYNDALACVFARLLLWTIPRALPAIGDENQAWDQYIEAWRPGKPHRSRWSDNYHQAREIVEV